MKVRAGFVSNSSSSSFLIHGDCKNGAIEILEKFGIDYYEVGWDDTYTEIINEEHVLYHILKKISQQEFPMDICCPSLSDKDKYTEYKGKLGGSVYIPKGVIDEN